MSCLTPATRSFLDGVYRTLFEQHPQPMWVYDTERLTFLAVNAAAIRHYGYSAEEFASLRVADIHADVEPRFSRKRGDLHRRKDGTQLEVETTSTRVTIDGIAARLVTVEDVTERNRAERALRESKQRYRALVGDSYDAICLVDVEGRIIYLNPTLHRMFGYDEEELLGQDGFALIHREDISRVEELRRELVARPGATVTFECRARQKSGEWRWLQGIAANLLDDPGVGALVLNYRDVTSRRRAELALRDDTRTAGAAEWIWTVDTNGVLLSSTEAVETMLGYRPADIVGKPFHDLYFPESRDKVAQFFARLVAAKSGWTDLVQRLRHRDGSECFVETSAVPLFDANGNLTGFRGSDRDVTNRTKFEQRIRHESRRDALTGLANRTFFQERLASEIARIAKMQANEQIAVLYLDLDEFKLLNDTFGHPVGDNTLQVIASMVRALAGADENVARIGSDELAVFLSGIECVDEARRMAKKILDAIAIPLVLDGTELRVSASVGISIYPSDGVTSASLVRNAEHAMHRAKELGRNKIQPFTHAMHEEHARRLALESDLARALERNEFLLHYQPLLDASTWQVCGIEALIRWQHPTRGLLAPDAFIDIAERSGAIVPIGAWVLRQACIDVQRFRAKHGSNVRVAVNLSARQLQEPELIETVRAIVAETGMDPHLLELEITESVAMQNAEATLAALRALKEMGVSLAVDDFGTGFSSLVYLTRFPIDTVKVDRQFVGKVTTDENAAAVVEAVVALARSLRLKTVAEGVETSEQRDFLIRHRCVEMQGFLFAPPVGIEELLDS